MAVSFGIQSYIEGGVITGVVAINIAVGFTQDLKAEKTMDSLRSLSSPTANVVRDGASTSIATKHVVPGDMVELKTGDTIPADLRLIEAVNFETDEALLTGESLPVEKRAEATFDEATGPGDRLNVAYSSSTVTKGRARGVVFATGLFTEIGSIASALRTKDSRVRPVKRKSDGSAKPHRYVQAWGLTLYDAVGNFLGVNVGTPLSRKLSRLACLLFGIAVICAIIVLAANNFANYPEFPGSNPTQEVAIYAVATGLAMIPASLIVVLTITMAAGTTRMVERHVIVRKQDALEALGGVTDICSDKTGTLTQGKMVAKRAWIPAKGTYSVGESSAPFDPTQGALSFRPVPPSKMNFAAADEKSEDKSHQDLLQNNMHFEEYLRVASLANLATVHFTEGQWKARGDPTEIAIQVFASRFDWNRVPRTSGNTPAWTQLAEFPFDSDVKKMSVIFRDNATEQNHVFTKGAVERIIGSCTHIHVEDTATAIELTKAHRIEIMANMDAMSALGLRCLALASRIYASEAHVDADNLDRTNIETNLTFRGLIGLYDPPRPESAGAVRQCHEAGIAVHMLTGDHVGTASAIATQVGILPSRMGDFRRDVADAMVMTATQFDGLSDNQIDALPVLPLVVARCAPNTKVRMIDALHRRQRFAAMTGDGVNDSPALHCADVGIAMGQAGSDVAKDASDIILTDDNFASILHAVEEGRRVFDNIQKFVLHLLALNVAQALILLVGLAFKDTRDLSVFPLSPIEILWLIMVTSGLPDMGLGFERAAPDVMRRQPMTSGIFSWELLVDMVVYGVWIAALCLGAFALVVFGFGDGSLGSGCNDGFSDGCALVFRARSTTFATVTWCSLFLAWEMVDMRRSFFNMRPDAEGPLFRRWWRDVWGNRFLFWSVLAGFITIFPVLYIPVINTDVFVHTGISWEWAIVFVATALFFVGAEGWKWGKRRYFRRAEGECAHDGQGDMEKRAFGMYMDLPERKGSLRKSSVASL